jgi:transcriptional regulator with XRE-family HTH domain
MSKTLLQRDFEQIPKEKRQYFRKLNEIGDQIESMLMAKKLNQRELAKKIGVKESYISRILTGDQNLTIKTIAKIEAALDTVVLVTPMSYERQKVKSRSNTLNLSNLQMTSPHDSISINDVKVGATGRLTVSEILARRSERYA